jgi:predicted metal-dependent phosphoesterase TrpH
MMDIVHISDGGLDLLRQINHRIAEWFDGMTMTDHNTLESVKVAQYNHHRMKN